MTTRIAAIGVGVCLAITLGVSSRSAAQSRRERKAEVVEESGKPKNVTGGSTFTVTNFYDKTYDAVLNFLKRGGETIEQASKETGQIVTGMVIRGGYSQTGTRILVTLIKDSDTSTTIRVAVTEQKRKKLLQTEPWSDPKVNVKQTEDIASHIKDSMGAAGG